MTTRSRPRRTPAGRSRDPLTADEIVAVLREKAQRWLHLPNVTSIGVGHEIDRRGRRSGELAIQVTVAQKLDDAGEIARRGWRRLPDHIDGPGRRRIPVDVVERTYRPGFTVVAPTAPHAGVAAAVAPAVLRRRRLDPVRPGISIGHVHSLAGTLGAIVFDKSTGAPFILGNFHVLQGAAGSLHDRVVQPGPNDDGNVGANAVGEVVRSHLGLAGDCAIATITGRSFDPAILELEIVPRRMARADIGDLVVKSGRTTGVTRGVVTRVGVVFTHDYGGAIGVRQIGAFEIGPAPGGGVLSKEGDSGAVWVVEENGVTDIVAGLHVALDTSLGASDDHALACPIHSVCDRLDVTFAP